MPNHRGSGVTVIERHQPPNGLALSRERRELVSSTLPERLVRGSTAAAPG